jgi:hypothetical protein
MSYRVALPFMLKPTKLSIRVLDFEPKFCIYFSVPRRVPPNQILLTETNYCAALHVALDGLSRRMCMLGCRR